MTVVEQRTGLMDTYRRWPVTFVSGSGATLIDSDGRSYIDLVAGIAVAVLGHAHPRLTAAIGEQAARLVHVSNLYETEPARDLADRLGQMTGMSSFFCNSGAEAIECALKLARKWGRNERGVEDPTIVAADGGFHGRTFGALAATGQPGKQTPFAPMVPGFVHVPFGDGDALERAFGRSVVAVLLEPIQGEAGIIVPPDDYLARARELCSAHGALLILDEVQTGMGRTGRWFGHHHHDVDPDVMCLAKGLAGGLPMGACLARPGVASAFSQGDHGSTFGGGPVQSAAALAVLDTIEDEGLVDRARDLGSELERGLTEVFPTATVRGKGLMLGVSLPAPLARAVVAGALEAGVLVNDPAPDVVRLTPPLVIERSQIETALGVLGEVWDEVRQA